MGLGTSGGPGSCSEVAVAAAQLACSLDAVDGLVVGVDLEFDDGAVVEVAAWSESAGFDPLFDSRLLHRLVDVGEDVDEFGFGLEVAGFGCVAAGGFDVDVLFAGGAGDGLVVGVGEEGVSALAGCAVVVAAGDGGAGADEVLFGGVDGADELAGALLVGADEVLYVVVELVGVGLVCDVVGVGLEPFGEVGCADGVECGWGAAGGLLGDFGYPVGQFLSDGAGEFGGVEVDDEWGCVAAVAADGSGADGVEFLDAVVEFVEEPGDLVEHVGEAGGAVVAEVVLGGAFAVLA
jgi:hypothetical protein